MIEIIEIEHAEYWDKVVTDFPKYDIYYLSGYLKAFQEHGDGQPILFKYKDEYCQAICVMFKRDIYSHPVFNKLIAPCTYFDLITPYGYGGFIFKGVVEQESLQNFIKEYNAFLKENNIISSFTRYHPQLQNVQLMRQILPVIDLGTTIAMELDTPELIWSNITSKNRNMIRKAQKHGVTIHNGTDRKLLSRFKEMYDATMLKDQADPYYFFDESFYDSIARDLEGNFQLFYAKLEEKIIAMSIFIFSEHMMHYHLSGSETAYRHLAPSNLLIYEAACWGHQQGFKTLHLGGGLGSGEDNLYKFKKAFNPNSRNQFSIGKHIVDNTVYEYLRELRKKHDPEFNDASHFFPVYRA